VRADILDAELPDQELRQLEDARCDLRAQLTHCADTGRRRGDDGFEIAKDPGEPACERLRLIEIPAVLMELSAAGLLPREHHFVPEPLQHGDAALDASGKSVSPRHVTKSPMRIREFTELSYSTTASSRPRRSATLRRRAT